MKINKWITGLTAFGVFATTALAGKAPATTANPANSKDKTAAKNHATVVTAEDPDTHKNNQGKGHFKAKGKGHHKTDVSEVE